jgi:hypothetical protein
MRFAVSRTVRIELRAELDELRAELDESRSELTVSRAVLDESRMELVFELEPEVLDE